jgi:phosphate transport system substrate-binding protein
MTVKWGFPIASSIVFRSSETLLRSSDWEGVSKGHQRKMPYPLVTYSWILLYGNYPDGKKGAVVKDFIKWGITDGQRYAESLGYCPLPDFIRELSTKAIGEIK